MSCISCVIFVAAKLLHRPLSTQLSHILACVFAVFAIPAIMFSHLFNSIIKGKPYLFYRSLNDVTYNPHVSLLTQTVHSRNCLSFNHWIPLRFQDVNTVCHCQVQPEYEIISCSSFKGFPILTLWRLSRWS